MSKKRLDPSWTKWLNENLQRGCAPDELLAILLDNQFHIGSIKKGMGARFPAHSAIALAAEGRRPDPIDYAAIARPRLMRSNLQSDRDEQFTVCFAIALQQSFELLCRGHRGLSRIRRPLISFSG